LTGVAVECAMNTTIAIELIKNVATPWPRLETDTTVMSIGAARPLEDAYRIASHDLVCWTAALCRLDVLDAYQLVAQAGDGLIGNVCDPNYTVTAAIDKRYLPPIDAYHGAHQRLSALATEHR
jgi:acetamidase/formamidase